MTNWEEDRRRSNAYFALPQFSEVVEGRFDDFLVQQKHTAADGYNFTDPLDIVFGDIPLDRIVAVLDEKPFCFAKSFVTASPDVDALERLAFSGSYETKADYFSAMKHPTHREDVVNIALLSIFVHRFTVRQERPDYALALREIRRHWLDFYRTEQGWNDDAERNRQVIGVLSYVPEYNKEAFAKSLAYMAREAEESFERVYKSRCNILDGESLYGKPQGKRLKGISSTVRNLCHGLQGKMASIHSADPHIPLYKFCNGKK